MPTTELLARGPWVPSQVKVKWSSDPFKADAESTMQADHELDRLRERGSPSYDGLAARLAGFRVTDSGLELDLQPIRWSLRLLDRAAGSLSAQCVLRDADGRWLAGRRAAWVASWAGRWALGAAGAVEVDENPVDTMVRELQEEWSVQPRRLSVEALIEVETGMVMIVGQAWLADGETVSPDDEHDRYAWWPADLSRWPAEGDVPLRDVATLLTTPPAARLSRG
ncbi:MAG: NUDIX hydrolase [Solirubrobacteraceae bacterium]